MKLEDIEALAEAELGLDPSNLEVESTNTPFLHNKFYKILNREVMTLSVLEQELSVLVHEKTNYFSGKADPDAYKEQPLDIIILSKDVDRYVDADRSVVNKRLTYAGQKQKVKYLESVIKEINNRTHHIRNAIAFMNFKNGVNR
jgi:hypothetical protein